MPSTVRQSVCLLTFGLLVSAPSLAQSAPAKAASPKLSRQGLPAKPALVPAAPAPQEGAGAKAALDWQHVPHLPVEKYVLPENGLEVLLSPDPSLPLVAVNVWYHVGPANEPDERSGFAHLFEHLMFQGSAHVGDDQHFKLLESRGASLINGTTSFDRTNYFETVPANELELALWLESDRMGFLADSINSVSLENQRQVVMNERRQNVDNRPYGPSSERLLQAMLPPSHPYFGNIIGSLADLDKATVADVKQFYDRYYAPANATLAIAGDFDKKAVKALVARYFGTLPRRAKPAAIDVVTPPIKAAKRVTVHEKVRLAQINKAWLGPKAFGDEAAEAVMLAEIMGQGEASRLHRRLVYELGLAQDVDVSQSSFSLAGFFTITATARPGADLNRIERELDAAVAHARSQAPTAAELTRAKNQIVMELLSGLERLGGFGGKADMLNRYNHYLGTPDYLRQDLARFSKVTAASVLAFAQHTLQPTGQVVVLTVPEP